MVPFDSYYMGSLFIQLLAYTFRTRMNTIIPVSGLLMRFYRHFSPSLKKRKRVKRYQWFYIIVYLYTHKTITLSYPWESWETTKKQN